MKSSLEEMHEVRLKLHEKLSTMTEEEANRINFDSMFAAHLAYICLI
jgi:hypothetical protein